MPTARNGEVELHGWDLLRTGEAAGRSFTAEIAEGLSARGVADAERLAAAAAGLALLAWQERGFNNAFVTLSVEGPEDADALGNNPLYADGELIGRATSGNYGFRLEQSLALAMIRPEFAQEGAKMDIEILGQRYPAAVISESPWDPRNERLRA